MPTRRSSRCWRDRLRWCRAPRLSERLGIETHLKFEGMNPTGSFKDRGMTLAVSAAKAKGAEAIICASTGNTAASAAAYAARAGMRGAVIVPEGKIARGKLAQALMHGARVISLRGNFDQALELVKQIVERQPGRARQLDQPVPHRGPEDGGVRGLRRAGRGARRARDSRSATPATSLPGGRASSSTARAARTCTGSRPRAPRRSCSATSSRTPRRSRPRSGSATRRAGTRRRSRSRESGGRDRGGQRRGDPRCAALARRQRGRVLRAGVGRLAWPAC